MRKNYTWNFFAAAVLIGVIAIYATGNSDVAIGKVKIWFKPVQTFFNAGMGAVKDDNSADSVRVAVPEAPKATKKVRPAVKTDAMKAKKDTSPAKSTTPPADTTSTFGF